jgi:hypothetical protein
VGLIVASFPMYGLSAAGTSRPPSTRW